MLIERLSLSNFRNFESAVFHFDQGPYFEDGSPGGRTLIAGPNGAGKSTILDAIAWVLTGECRGVDGRGAGQKDLIRIGADVATVTLVMDGKTYQREVDAAGARATVKPDLILERLGVSKAMLRACLDGQSFFDLDHKAAKAMLLDLLNVVVTPEDIPELGLKAPIDLADLDFRYQKAFADRAAAKKALADYHVPDLPKVADIDAGAVADIEAIRSERVAARDASQQARDAWTTAEARAKAIAEEVKAARKAQDSVADWEHKIEAHRAMLQEVEAAGAAIAQPVLAEGARSMSDIQRELSDLQAALTRIQHHKPSGGCVLNQAIPCHTPAQDFRIYVEGINGNIKSLKTAMKDAEQVTRDQAAYDAAVAANRKTADYHRGQLAQLGAAVAAAGQGKARIADLEKEAKGLLKRLPALQDAANATMKADADAERRLMAATTYQAAVQARQAALDRRAKAEADVERLEALVDKLGPKGVRVQVLDRSLGQFTSILNEALEGFGFTMAFQVEPWQVTVSGRRYDLLSAGERLMVGAAFQQALALANDLDFAAIDASEVVVGDKRDALTELIMTSPVRQILVAIAKGEDEPMPEIDGLQIIQPHKR